MKEIDITKMTEEEAVRHLKGLGYSEEKAREMWAIETGKSKGDTIQEGDES